MVDSEIEQTEHHDKETTGQSSSDDGGPDIFETRDSVDSEAQRTAKGEASDDVSHELPVELASLSDRFVESLSARVHTLPPSIERISSLFQDFYVRTDSHIATHISTLASRINRDNSPSKTSSGATPQQMLTVSEIAERRKARKELPLKQLALEETVEKRVCEKVYDKIWRHKSSLDEVRDEKMRSKTAALSLLGMGLQDLGIEISDANEEKEKDAKLKLSAAGEDLRKMNDMLYPLGKIQCLISAHKAIVDALTILLGSSSSADEILPALIYTLITSPPEGINVISNLLFIQRFRATSKISGESAYCLTNLEAAISFLESVDLSSLDTDAPVDGQPRLLNAVTTSSTTDSSGNARSAKGSTADVGKASKETASDTLSRSQLSAPTAQQRRLSNLFQPPSKVLGAANDAVRSTADQGLKNISNTLDNSFNFLFGRLKEMQNDRGVNEQPLVPKTLDEARRLVTNPPVLKENDLEIDSVSNVDSQEDHTQQSGLRPENRRYNSGDGRRTPRDRSADSARSSDGGGSNKRVTSFPSGLLSNASTPSPVVTPLESMKSFGTTFNPLSHIPGMIGRFGRITPETPPAAATASAPDISGNTLQPDRPRITSKSSLSTMTTSSGITTTTSLSTAVPLSAEQLSQLDPPIERFLHIDDPQELRIGDVAELLQDYKRLAALFITQSSSSK